VCVCVCVCVWAGESTHKNSNSIYKVIVGADPRRIKLYVVIFLDDLHSMRSRMDATYQMTGMAHDGERADKRPGDPMDRYRLYCTLHTSILTAYWWLDMLHTA
jgi:hypothetical protein